VKKHQRIDPKIVGNTKVRLSQKGFIIVNYPLRQRTKDMQMQIDS
jgi:hypothetical protein